MPGHSGNCDVKVGGDSNCFVLRDAECTEVGVICLGQATAQGALEGEAPAGKTASSQETAADVTAMEMPVVASVASSARQSQADEAARIQVPMAMRRRGAEEKKP